MEIWKAVPNWEGLYEVSNYGRVKSLARETTYVRKGKKVVRHSAEKIYDYSNIKSNDYTLATFRFLGKFEQIYIHTLVASLFIENKNPNKNTQVNHKDGNKRNNKYTNLEWCTPGYNTQHAYNTGLADGVRKAAQRTHGKITEQYDMNQNLIATFPSVKEASKITGVAIDGIYRNCTNEYKSYSGFIWKYKS